MSRVPHFTVVWPGLFRFVDARFVDAQAGPSPDSSSLFVFWILYRRLISYCRPGGSRRIIAGNIWELDAPCQRGRRMGAAPCRLRGKAPGFVWHQNDGIGLDK